MSQNKNLSLIILGVIALLLIGFVTRPLFLDIKNTSENLVFQKGQLIDLENKSENIKKFQIAYESRQANLEKMGKLFVDKEEPIGFIKFLEKEAKTARLFIEITPTTSKVVAGDFWPSTNFQLTLNGSFPHFLQFLDRLESSPYLIELSNLSLNKPGQNTNGDIAISFQMKVYTQ